MPPKSKGSLLWLVASRYSPVEDWRVWSFFWRGWSHTLNTLEVILASTTTEGGHI